MKIIEELEKLGVEITDAIKSKFDGDFVSREEMDKKVKKAEVERDNWKTKAETSETALKELEGKDIEGITKARDEWKEKYEQLDKDVKNKEALEEKNALLDEAFKDVKFSSKAAEESIRSKIADNVTVKDGKLIGFNDLLVAEKEADNTAFVSDEAAGAARFNTSNKGGSEPITGDPNTMDTATYLKWRKQQKNE